ncbi:hypothetical protein AB0918_18770 [Streptomyces sp. NPDC006864]|uniref:hypothetical protein n=1 Tax=Streptomyces sp. NPDC006864 TaxID=3154780 RepID=UPI003452D4E8
MTSSHDPGPEAFRELLRETRYDYPEDTRTGGRGQRRRARRQHRTEQRRLTARRLDQERRREPTRARAALLVVLLLLAIGTAARYGPDWLTGSAGQVTTAPASPSTAPPSQTDDKPPAAAPSPTASALDRSTPDTVAEQFARAYLTRNPPVDQSHGTVVRRAAPWATPPLVQNLTEHSDPAWDRLVSRGGVSTVSAVTVKPAGADLPVDTPLRVWRTITATVDVEGYTRYTERTVLRAELVSAGGGWRVSRLLGV